MHKTTVTIFIPCYNAEQNIARLLRALVRQRYNSLTLKNIVVLSDVSNDRTLSEARSVAHPKIKIHTNTTRQGFAYGVKKILTETTSDIVVMVNDDIVVKSNSVIEKVCLPLVESPRVGLAGGNVEPLPSKNFIQKTANIGFVLFRRSARSMQSMHNKLTCDGKILALSKRFFKKLEYPTNLGQMGNVDAYIYFSCLQNGYKYFFVSDATVYFNNVDTLTDFIKFASRNSQSSNIVDKKFLSLARSESIPPKRFFEYVQPSELFAFLPSLLMLFCVHWYIALKNIVDRSAFSAVWSPVQSTKKLHHI